MAERSGLKVWAAHMQAARRERKSISRYGAEHALSPYTQYGWFKVLRGENDVRVGKMGANWRRRHPAEEHGEPQPSYQHCSK